MAFNIVFYLRCYWIIFSIQVHFSPSISFQSLKEVSCFSFIYCNDGNTVFCFLILLHAFLRNFLILAIILCTVPSKHDYDYQSHWKYYILFSILLDHFHRKNLLSILLMFFFFFFFFFLQGTIWVFAKSKTALYRQFV